MFVENDLLISLLFVDGQFLSIVEKLIPMFFPLEKL